MLTRDEAYSLVTSWTTNPNLVKHMLAVEAEMRSLARHFGEDEDLWGLTGLLHDADYEMFKDDVIKHPSKILDELEGRNADPKIINAIKAHAWGPDRPQMPEPSSNLEWSLFTCDDLSGYIIACALVRPDKKLASLTVESLKKKWNTKGFAAGVHREHVKLCESKLGISLDDYLKICLEAIQGISADLGL